MMDILVCMKAVPSACEVQVDGQFKLRRDSTKLQWNIADEAALEVALQLKSADTAVTVLSMGPEKLEASMRELLARGADHAVLVTDPAFAGSDTIATAKALCKAAEKIGKFDLILCGRRAIDGETGQVPGMLAAAMNIPCITSAEKIVRSENGFHIHRRLEDGTVLLNATCPVCVSVCEYTYTLRLPGIMGMRRAKSKAIWKLNAEALGLHPSQCGLKGSLTKVVAMDCKFPGLRKGPKESDPNTGVKSLLFVLKEGSV